MNWELQKLANKIKFNDVQKEIDYRTSKKTLDTLIMYCDEEDCSTFVSMESIKQQIRCNSMQTVYNHFEKLQGLGLLEVYKKGRYMMKKITIKDSTEPSILSSTEPSILSSTEPSILSSKPVEAKVSKGKEDNKRSNDATAKASAGDIPNSNSKQSNADLFEIIWKVYSLEFIKKKSGRDYGSKSATIKKFNVVMKHKFKGVKMENIHYVLTDYIDDYMEQHKHNPKYAKNLSNILTIDDIQEYINIVLEQQKDN